MIGALTTGLPGAGEGQRSRPDPAPSCWGGRLKLTAINRPFHYCFMATNTYPRLHTHCLEMVGD